MDLRKDIERAVRHVVAGDYKNPISNTQSDKYINGAIKAFENHTYCFSSYSSMFLNQGSKCRSVKYYADIYSPENVLCYCVKQILDRTFKIKYPNRNKTIRNLFSCIPALAQMSHFTVVKFDFKDYYNSVSSPYVFEKYIKSKLARRVELDLVKDFCYSTKYAYAGLCTSNTISEIIANNFDSDIYSKFAEKGLMFYERYIDDCILLLNEHISEDNIKDIINDILKNVYHSNIGLDICACKTKFNENKFRYLSSKSINTTPFSVDFLGYEFWFSANNKISIQYGITENKRKKYCKRVDKILNLYKNPKSADYNNLELLRHRILAFSSRTVYISKHYKSNIWKVKGFISNYGELRYLLDSSLLESNTQIFLKNMIEESFKRNSISIPYFLKCNGYSLYENMQKNKTLLLVEGIGYDYDSLSSLCKRIGISTVSSNGDPRCYGNLVREYLIKVKVGY